jgi:molecular chaperone GrpE
MTDEMNKDHAAREDQPLGNQDGTKTESDVENAGEAVEQFLDEEVAEVLEAQDSAHEKFLRLMADFDNFRRRSAKEKAQERQRGRRDAAEKLLPVFDSLTSGLLTVKSDDPVRSGMEAIFNQLLNSFKQIGIEKVETKGKPFDPETMEAVANFPNPQVPEGHVMEESRAGFRDELGLLRPAQVIVSAGKGA